MNSRETLLVGMERLVRVEHRTYVPSHKQKFRLDDRVKERF